MATQMRTRTPYDFPHLEELQRVSAKSFAKKLNVVLRTFLLLTGTFDLAAGIHFLSQGSVGVSVFLCLMGAALLAWGLFFYPIRAWAVGKALGDPDFCNDFVLAEDALVIYVGNEETRYPYQDCSMLLEADLCFYFIKPDKQGLMLDKANLKGGSVDQLRAFLEEKCGQTTRWVGKKRK